MTDGSLAVSVGASEVLLLRTYEDGNEGIEQLHHLSISVRLPNVDLRILPFKAGQHRSRAGSFTLLSRGSLEIGYQEYAIGGHLVAEEDAGEQSEVSHDPRHHPSDVLMITRHQQNQPSCTHPCRLTLP